MQFFSFNPHSRKGSDEIEGYNPPIFGVSIHTPARGVTLRQRMHSCVTARFNPHSRKGSDNETFTHLGASAGFNPHSRKGSDHIKQWCVSIPGSFNPHSRKGSDFVLYIVRRRWRVSIHTPARGVTGLDNMTLSMLPVSIHTPARGVTILEYRMTIGGWFQSTLPQGE